MIEAPNWYSAEEISHWLRCKGYAERVAMELAEIIAENHQLAFKKDWDMGMRGAAYMPFPEK